MTTNNANMGIDDILDLVAGTDHDDKYNTLNMILWSLQKLGAVDFHENRLDELDSEPAY